MLRLAGRAARYGEVWYSEPVPALPEVDILVYRQQAGPRPRTRTQPMLTITSDLAGSGDGIADAFDRECRYEVRRAEARDVLLHESHPDPATVLHAFREAFTAFAQRNGVRGPDDVWLDAARAEGRLHLTCASQAGERLVWHAYLRCGTTVRLMHSVSLFRGAAPAYRALVGRANRWLHWRDMLMFHFLGVECYDWGGLFEEEREAGQAGINRFKRSFGGQPMRTYDCTAAVTARGHLYLPLRDTWRRLRNLPEARAKARRPSWQPS